MKIVRSLIICTLITTIFLSLLMVSCTAKYVYETPGQTDDGWETASLNEVRLNESKLSELISHVNQGQYENIHSILIIKDEKLVFEKYFPGYRFDYFGDQFQGEYIEFDINTIHNLASVTKAFTAALIGIAIDKGFIQDVEERVFTFFPEYSYLNDENKDKITIEHLLTMTSGLDWNEGDVPLTDTERNDLIRLFYVPDPIEYILSKSVITEPGTHFYYSGGDVNLLGEIIGRATGLRIDDFAEKYLFSPLGISNYEWKFLNDNIVYTSGDLAMRPRDMAKLGQLYLNNGIWNHEQIISEDWIKSSTSKYVPVANDYMSKAYGDRYGYQWFLQKFDVDSTSIDSVSRDGWGGQRIQVFPSVNTVVVFTGGNYATEPTPVNDIITRFILPAVR